MISSTTSLVSCMTGIDITSVALYVFPDLSSYVIFIFTEVVFCSASGFTLKTNHAFIAVFSILSIKNELLD